MSVLGGKTMNYSRAVGVARFVLVLLIIALLMFMAVCGVGSQKGVFEEGTITLGLDLQGGSIITFRAIPAEGEKITDDGMRSVLTAMRNRLDQSGLTEAQCYLVGDDKVTIEIPGDSDPTSAVETYGIKGELTFEMYDPSTGDYTKVMLTGDDIKSSYPGLDDYGKNLVVLNFTDEGKARFKEATAACAALKGEKHNFLYIKMDGKAISQPSVEQTIDNDSAVISGESMTSSYVNTLSGIINDGALNYTLEVGSINSVGPTLGEKSLSKSLVAGAIGIALVIIFMIIIYRVPGVMASIALVCYTAIFLLVLALANTNLTLPGIAGIVLSIGMAVDANVVIFERTKEELRNGRTVKAAIKEGYSKAFSAILDSNVTTVIAALVLYILGSGTIRGFAVTLGLGVVISFVTALVVTRILLNLGVAMGLTKTTLYGVKERSAK